MRKVVLKAENEADLLSLRDELISANVPHHLWQEQPENVPSCLVSYPRDKHAICHLFKKFKLFK